MEGAQPLPDGLGSSRFVSPSLGALCSFGRDWGCWCWKAFFAASISLGPGIVRPAFIAPLRGYAWKMRRAGHSAMERNGAVGTRIGP